VREYSLPPEFTGLWVRTQQADYIVVARGLIPSQHQQAIVHEVAHMLLRHQPGAITSPAGLREALGVPKSMWALARSGYRYGSDEEEEAETLATVICLRLMLSEEGLPADPNLGRFHALIA
jgi:hypothetical protein